MARLASKVWNEDADVLSVAEEDLQDPHSTNECLSGFGNSSSWALEKPEKMDPSEKVVSARAAARTQLSRIMSSCFSA